MNILYKFCGDEWRPLIDNYSAKINFKAKEKIFNFNDPVEHVYFIEKGKVKVTSVNSNSHEKVIRLAKDGDIVGHRGISKKKTYPVSAYALTDITLVRLPLDIFLSILKANPEFCFFMMEFFAEELYSSEKRIRDLLSVPVKHRVAHALLLNANVFGFDQKDLQKLEFTISRQDIADLAGTTYESVVRVLSELNKKKIIQLVGKEIRILKIEALQELAGVEELVVE